MTVIYIDVLLALNLYIDYVLLSATARVLGIPTVRKRVIAAAVLGSLSSLVMLLPTIHACLAALYNCAIAAAMIFFGFRTRSAVLFGKSVFVLFVISSLFAGICGACQTALHPTGLIVHNGVVYWHVPPLMLLLFTTAAYLVLCIYDRVTKRRLVRNELFYVEVFHHDLHVRLRTMYDSGHRLCDPFSGTPVIVVNRHALGIMASAVDPATADHPPRYIPFSGIGGNGIMPSFRPTRAVLHGTNRSIDISGVRIAVCDTFQSRLYDALIGPAIADDILTSKGDDSHAHPASPTVAQTHRS